MSGEYGHIGGTDFSIDDQATPEASVAAVAVQVIGELHRMINEGWAHDEKSVAMVQGAVAWMTSILDGKCANPKFIVEGFVSACTAVDQSLLDEIDRCQTFLNVAIENAKKAEGRALANELYAGWYLRLRDGDSGAAWVSKGMQSNGVIDGIRGEDLDAEMEDIDEARKPPELPKNAAVKRDPLFDEFDDDVIF